jgi:hypothetical protein
VSTNEQEISGAKNYYLKGTIAATDGTSDSVVTSWNHSALGYVAAVASGSVGGTSTFVWTDQSLKSPHTEATADWSNDYLVKGLPLDSWTLSN